MPVYEYYCPACDARFSHLARTFDVPPPPCPGCGSSEVEKLISRVNVAHTEQQRRETLDDAARSVDRDDPAAVARFLGQTGSLAEREVGIDHDTFQGIVEARARGATEEEVERIAEDISLPESGHGHADDHGHAHHHDHHHGHDSDRSHAPREAQDLGWV